MYFGEKEGRKSLTNTHITFLVSVSEQLCLCLFIPAVHSLLSFIQKEFRIRALDVKLSSLVALFPDATFPSRSHSAKVLSRFPMGILAVNDSTMTT